MSLKYEKQIVDCITKVYYKGLTTTSGGNISVMDENGYLYITPSGKDKGTLCPQDIAKISPTGEVINGIKPSIEVPFHTRLYTLRDSIKAVLHSHSPYLATFSLFCESPSTRICPAYYNKAGSIGYSYYDIPGSVSLGKQICSVIEQNNYDSVIMQNHGSVIVAPDLEQAFEKLEIIENSAKISLRARKLGKINELSIEDIQKYNKEVTFESIKSDTVYANDKIKTLCDLIKRCYTLGYFTSTNGSVSMRIDDKSFIISNSNASLANICEKDFTLVTNGKIVYGSQDSHYLIDQMIYSKHSNINSIFKASCPNIMCYAVTNTEINSRALPESYIMMRDIARVPFVPFNELPSLVSDNINCCTHNVLIENNMLITTGNSPIQAFDRLEVSEVTAKILIDCMDIGIAQNISNEEIEKIDNAFGLAKKEA